MSFVYENILAWIRKDVQQSSANLNEQYHFALLTLSAIEEVIEEIEHLTETLLEALPNQRSYRGL